MILTSVLLRFMPKSSFPPAASTRPSAIITAAKYARSCPMDPWGSTCGSWGQTTPEVAVTALPLPRPPAARTLPPPSFTIWKELRASPIAMREVCVHCSCT